VSTLLNMNNETNWFNYYANRYEPLSVINPMPLERRVSNRLKASATPYSIHPSAAGAEKQRTPTSRS
jgi:hypothetical protein